MGWHYSPFRPLGALQSIAREVSCRRWRQGMIWPLGRYATVRSRQGGMADIEDVDNILADGKDDPVLVPLRPAVEQLPDLLGELVAFRGQGATSRIAAECVDFLDQAVVPPGRDGGG